jgi:hypothetical protein
MMRPEMEGPSPSGEGGTSLRQFTQNDQADTADARGKQEYPGPVGSRLFVGAARIGMRSWARPEEIPLVLMRHAVPPIKPGTVSKGGVNGKPFETFHSFPNAHAAKAALRRRYKQLAALAITSPKEHIGPARLTPLASRSARGQEFASELRRHGVEVSNIPVEESQPGDFFWLDALVWQPPRAGHAIHERREVRLGGFIMDLDTEEPRQPEVGWPSHPFHMAALERAVADDRGVVPRAPASARARAPPSYRARR